MEKIYILTATSHSDGKTEIIDAYRNIEDAQEDMKTRYESSKRFWENYEKEWNCKLADRFEEVFIELYNTYAEAYTIDADYEEMGMSWNIETLTIK